MKTCLRFLLALAVLLPLASCEKPAVGVSQANPDLEKTQTELAEARDALQRQALEIETKTALMDKQLADMAQALKERENAELRSSLDALKQQNDDLRLQADAARRQSNVIAQKIAPMPQVTVNATVTAPRDYSLFYDQLGSYGRWFDVSGYGYCWRPTITTPRWRPYLDGCWMWSSLGWMWQSNEPFGWIVYHYGRWVNLSRYGWVWVPGSEWAPAWVAWRQSRDYVGWAPLPPDSGPCIGVYRDCDSHYNLGPSSYTFINTNVFTQPTYTSVCAPVTYNTSIFQSSVNVTQIVRCDDRKRPNAFMHHGGPPRAQMEQACARPIQQVQVQTAAADQIPRHRPGHSRGEGRPQPVIVELPAARTGTPPVRPQIAEHIDKPKRVDAFEGVSQRVAQEIRETIDREKASAVVQQQPVLVEVPPQISDRPGRRPAPAPPPAAQETVHPAIAIEDKPAAALIPAVATNEAPSRSPNRDSVETPNQRHRGSDAMRPSQVLAVQTPPESSNSPTPAVVSTSEPEKPASSAVVMPAQPFPVVASEAVPAVPNSTPPSAAETVPSQPVAAEKMTAEAASSEAQRQQEAQQRVAAEKMAAEQQAATAEAEKARMQAAAEQNQREQAQAAAMQQKQHEEQAAQQRAIAEKTAAKQAQTAAEGERVRQQAEAAAMQQRQQEEQAAQQRAIAEKMAAEQAQAAEAERTRQQAEAAAMQQRQQEEQAAQQRAVAEKMAAEQAQAAAAEAERVRQQAEAAAMQRQQEEAARRAAEEQMRREQEMVQRRAEEEARRQAEAEMRRAQEMAQRQAEEQARRAAEEQMRRAQEAAQRQAEEQARRAAEEQMRRAQEEAQRAAQEAAQRAAEEAARRAAEEAARNRPQP